MVFLELATLVVSTIVLSKSSSFVIDNATVIAKFFKISQIAIGLLLIAVSTSLPELSVSIMSSMAHEGAISAGNVFGSNIANILLILGIGAFINGFYVSRKNLVDIALALLLTTIISIYIIFHSQVSGNALGLVEGLVLLAIACWYCFQILEKRGEAHPSEGPEITRKEGLKAFLLFFLGIILVLVSSSFVVSSAITLAETLGLAKSFIGATIIAIGTSLPELSIDLAAIRKKNFGLALGDAIGSNVVNLTLVLGTAAVISPIVIQLKVFIAALLFAVVANMVFFYIAAVKREFRRTDGFVLLSMYALYLIVIFYLQAEETVLTLG